MPSAETSEKRGPGKGRRLRRVCCCSCGGCLSLLAVSVVALFFLLQRVPKTYPPVANPIAPPDVQHPLGGGLDGFESPYIGHTGSWDGKGGGMFGSSKNPDLDAEQRMGLRWTFMAVYWRALEPNGPVDLTRGVPEAWQALDRFVIEAHRRGLNILMQAPVVGGNAGGPPDWAGRRQPGKSAPANMEALADFAEKLATRYRPDGTLARQQGWGTEYGVRAWEMDNEPEGYLTNWGGQAGDYAEFVTKAAARIHRVDPMAVILAPALAAGSGKHPWLEDALEASRLAGSPTFRQQGVPYSLGPATDAVSFHIYEGLDTAFSGRDRTLERVFSEVREVYERYEMQPGGFGYPRKMEYWHTEGNFDFIGAMSAERRAAWRFQFLTRAFAAGIRKVVVMDASIPEQVAIRSYVRTLPNPFPMARAAERIQVLNGKAVAFCHGDPPEKQPESAGREGQVWVVWAEANTGDATVEVPMVQSTVEAVSVDGSRQTLTASNGRVRIYLQGDAKMPPPLLLIDRTPVK